MNSLFKKALVALSLTIAVSIVSQPVQASVWSDVYEYAASAYAKLPTLSRNQKIVVGGLSLAGVVYFLGSQVYAAWKKCGHDATSGLQQQGMGPQSVPHSNQSSTQQMGLSPSADLPSEHEQEGYSSSEGSSSDEEEETNEDDQGDAAQSDPDQQNQPSQLNNNEKEEETDNQDTLNLSRSFRIDILNSTDLTDLSASDDFTLQEMAKSNYDAIKEGLETLETASDKQIQRRANHKTAMLNMGDIHVSQYDSELVEAMIRGLNDLTLAVRTLFIPINQRLADAKIRIPYDLLESASRNLVSRPARIFTSGNIKKYLQSNQANKHSRKNLAQALRNLFDALQPVIKRFQRGNGGYSQALMPLNTSAYTNEATWKNLINNPPQYEELMKLVDKG